MNRRGFMGAVGGALALVSVGMNHFLRRPWGHRPAPLPGPDEYTITYDGHEVAYFKNGERLQDPPANGEFRLPSGFGIRIDAEGGLHYGPNAAPDMGLGAWDSDAYLYHVDVAEGADRTVLHTIRL